MVHEKVKQNTYSFNQCISLLLGSPRQALLDYTNYYIQSMYLLIFLYILLLL